MGASSIEFSRMARGISAAARDIGLEVPVFRSPPRVAGALRTLRRQAGGAVVVAVRFRGRQPSEVIDDLVEGVVVANGLSGGRAARVRSALRVAAGGAAPGRAA